MIYYLIPLILAYIIWLFLKSKSNFFYQDREVLADKRRLLQLTLFDFGFTQYQTSEIMKAFDTFRNYKEIYIFDGTTILADFQTIKGLDAPAMKHDYDYLMLRNKGFKIYLKGKIKADIEFGNNMRQLGVTWLNAWSRVALLLISTIVWMPLMKIQNKL